MMLLPRHHLDTQTDARHENAHMSGMECSTKGRTDAHAPEGPSQKAHCFVPYCCMHWHQLEVALVHQHAALTLSGKLCQEMVR